MYLGIVKVYIFYMFIQYSIHWDKIQMLQKVPLDKINITKNALFSFFFQLITVSGYESPLILEGVENFEVVYFPGGKLF